MAAKRISVSAVNWAKLAKEVHPTHRNNLRAFKSRSDGFLSRVQKNQESLPKIDFDFYKSKLGDAEFIDEIEEAYNSVEVPYPIDKDDVHAAINEAEERNGEAAKKILAELSYLRNLSQDLLDQHALIPSRNYMTTQMHDQYFSQTSPDPVNRCTAGLYPISPPIYWEEPLYRSDFDRPMGLNYESVKYKLLPKPCTTAVYF